MSYQVLFTEKAAAHRDALTPERSEKFDKGIALIADDPYTQLSRPMSATGDDRVIRLTQNILVEYTVSAGRLIVFIVEVFDDQDIAVV